MEISLEIGTLKRFVWAPTNGNPVVDENPYGNLDFGASAKSHDDFCRPAKGNSTFSEVAMGASGRHSNFWNCLSRNSAKRTWVFLVAFQTTDDVERHQYLSKTLLAFASWKLGQWQRGQLPF